MSCPLKTQFCQNFKYCWGLLDIPHETPTYTYYIENLGLNLFASSGAEKFIERNLTIFFEETYISKSQEDLLSQFGI